MIDDASPAAVKRLRRQLARSERELTAARRVAALAREVATQPDDDTREALLDALAAFDECHARRATDEWYPDEQWRARFTH